MPDSTLGGMAALLSRPALRQAFNRLLADPAHVDGHVVVVVLNVDRFKRVNDLLGFDAGDRILGQIVERLDLALNALTPRPLGLSLARLHGDELAVLLPADTAARGMPEWLADVLRALSVPLAVQSLRFVFSMSVGMAQCKASDAEFDALLSAAHMAMRRVKQRGGNGFELAEHLLPSASSGTGTGWGTEHHLLLGMEGRQFHTYYQPKVCAQTGRIVGFEALMRWLHPEKGLIPLDEFLPSLERSSLMLQVGLQIFQQLVHTQRHWQDIGCSMPISFNVSNGELLSAPFRERLVEMVQAAGVPIEDIGLEITERVLADVGDAGQTIVHELHEAGFRMSMDDFGVGTSSLSRLKHIPIDEIKVDRLFITGIVESARNLDLLRGIVKLGQSLGLKVVLEGVETLAEYQLACTLGDVQIQGFYHSKAVDAHTALVLAQQQPFAVPAIKQPGAYA